MESKKKVKSSRKKLKVETSVKDVSKTNDLSFEQFLDNWDDNSDVEEDSNEVPIANKKKKAKQVNKAEKKEGKQAKEDQKENNEEIQEDKSTGAKSQKKYLQSLKSKDPEFYDFLKECVIQLCQFLFNIKGNKVFKKLLKKKKL